MRLQVADQTVEVELRQAPDDHDFRVFQTRAPDQARVIQAETEGAPLLGSDLSWPPDFRLDGRGRYEQGRLKGWVQLGWNPRYRPGLRLIMAGRTIDLLPSLEADPDIQGRHALDLPVTGLSETEDFKLLANLPDGRWCELPTSPVVVHIPPPPRRQFRWFRRRRSRRREVAVVVPAYRGLEETTACLAALKGTLPPNAVVVIVDDACPEPELSEALRSFATDTKAELLVNQSNLGFVASVNRGVARHPDRDVVILNADTELFPGWLERLQDAAYSAPDIGTATPLTNAGTIASYPRGLGADCTSEEAATRDRMAARVNAGVRVEAPTGVGFCMYVRRDCWADTGELDTRLFGRGYGEENDFCLRATRAGWRHVIAADVYVRHLQGRSFGASATALRERNSRLLMRRHPDYFDRIEAFSERDPLHAARRRLDQARLLDLDRPVVLLVTLALPGGVGRVVDMRRAEAQAAGSLPLLLRPQWDREGLQLELTGDGDDADLSYALDEQEDLLAFLRALPIERVELHHFLDLPPELVEDVMQLGGERAVYVHDYALVCPRITLLGGDGVYCGEPPPEVCDRCVAAHGKTLNFDGPVADLRHRSASWLSRAHEVHAPCTDLLDRLQRYFSDAPLRLTPWENEVYPASPVPERIPPVIRIAVIGAIGFYKGYAPLLACAKDAVARRLPLEFVVIGHTRDDEEWSAVPSTFVTGRYEEDELPDLLARERPQAAIFASVSPETWCFALSHALRAGLPALAFDIGAIAERLRATDATYRLLPIESPPETINNALLELVVRSPPAAASSPQTRAIAAANVQTAHVALLQTPADDEPERRTMTDTSLGLTASVQLVTLNKGLYGVRSKGPAPTRVGDGADVLLPALQVVAAPGLPADSVEVMDGLRGGGGWLFDPTDMLVVKVKVSGTALLVTSYSARNLPSLSIEVERLDVRKAEAPPSPASTPPAPAQSLVPALSAAAVVPSLAAPVASGGARLTSDGRRRLPLRVDAHVSMIGDVGFTDPDWAGEIGRKLPLEAFAVTPLEGLSPEDIEYKAVTARGTETAWIKGGELCGVRRTATPLSGVAFRLKGSKAAAYECSYRGVFRSGVEVGPCAAGTPLKSSSLDDYLVGFQLSIVQASRAEEAPAPAAELFRSDAGRTSEPAPASVSEAPRQGLSGGPEVKQSRPIGPRFSVFRQDDV